MNEVFQYRAMPQEFRPKPYVHKEADAWCVSAFQYVYAPFHSWEDAIRFALTKASAIRY